jgi:uncharacterized membrane protein
MSDLPKILEKTPQLEERAETPPQPPAPPSTHGNYEYFCRRVGIWPTSDHSTTTTRGLKRPAKNQGTYDAIIRSQAKARVEYYATASLINFALFAQIIIAAAVTAISAAGGPLIALTVLGALQTILAGSLTWVKGQGIPDRLLSYANELRRVREYVEDVERQYEADPNFTLKVEEEVQKIYKLYDLARKNAEDSYVGTFKTITAENLRGDWDMLTGKGKKRTGSGLSLTDTSSSTGGAATGTGGAATGTGGAATGTGSAAAGSGGALTGTGGTANGPVGPQSAANQ